MPRIDAGALDARPGSQSRRQGVSPTGAAAAPGSAAVRIAAQSAGAESFRLRGVYSPSSFFAVLNAATARSMSSKLCAAESWTRMRALPFGTTG